MKAARWRRRKLEIVLRSSRSTCGRGGLPNENIEADVCGESRLELARTRDAAGVAVEKRLELEPRGWSSGTPRGSSCAARQGASRVRRRHRARWARPVGDCAHASRAVTSTISFAGKRRDRRGPAHFAIGPRSSGVSDATGSGAAAPATLIWSPGGTLSPSGDTRQPSSAMSGAGPGTVRPLAPCLGTADETGRRWPMSRSPGGEAG